MIHAKTGLALTVHQPWAWCLVAGLKPVENRSWPTNIRGWFGVHAGKKFDHDGYEWIRAEFPQIQLPAIAEFRRGGIIGRVRLIDCVETYDSPWFFGPYGFVVADAEQLPFTPCRGMQGFFRPQL